MPRNRSSEAWAPPRGSSQPPAPHGGRAEVYLDGKRAGTVDFYMPPNTVDDSLWHTYVLKPGRHTLRLVTTREKDPCSTGRECHLLGAVTYAK